eukprot:1502332-Pleurochrysis_carterae.AAC.1
MNRSDASPAACEPRATMSSARAWRRRSHAQSVQSTPSTQIGAEHTKPGPNVPDTHTDATRNLPV